MVISGSASLQVSEAFVLTQDTINTFWGTLNEDVVIVLIYWFATLPLWHSLELGLNEVSCSVVISEIRWVQRRISLCSQGAFVVKKEWLLRQTYHRWLGADQLILPSTIPTAATISSRLNCCRIVLFLHHYWSHPLLFLHFFLANAYFMPFFIGLFLIKPLILQIYLCRSTQLSLGLVLKRMLLVGNASFKFGSFMVKRL